MQVVPLGVDGKRRQPQALASWVVSALVCAALLAPAAVAVQKESADDFSTVGISERLGAQVPERLAFVDENGVAVTLADLLRNDRPTVLQLVYYECPSLCNFMLNGFVEVAKESRYHIGRDYDVVTVSIDHEETPELALAKKKAYVEMLGQPDVAASWRWLTGTKEAIAALAESVGYGYRYDGVQDEFAHGAALPVLTPQGQVSRYLYGVQYPVRNLDLALLEASDGKIARSISDRILLTCYRYDPSTRSYVLAAMTVMRIGGAIVVACLATLILGLLWRDRKKKMSLSMKTEAT